MGYFFVSTPQKSAYLRAKNALNNLTEVQEMALKNLAEWNEEKVASACGASGSCGADDEKKEEKPSACGSACGAGDK